MSLIRLTIVVIGLGLGIALVLSNPTTDDYLLFVEGQLGKAMDRSEQNQSTREQAMLKSIFRSHSHELMETAVRPHTLRRNMGVMSIYETSVFEVRIVVLGVAGSFIPLKGIDEAHPPSRTPRLLRFSSPLVLHRCG